MTQPQGFIDPQHPDYVCKLHKLIYGLRQAPRAWYTDLRQFLVSCGFKRAYSDNSVFIYNSLTVFLYVLIYVDDTIVTGSSCSHITFVINHLVQRFSIKDLGSLHFFLNIEGIPFDQGLLLTQSKFAADLLSRFNMLNAKGVSTPMSSSESLLQNDGFPSANATEYRQVVGALQYLTTTQPDISFVVN